MDEFVDIDEIGADTAFLNETNLDPRTARRRQNIIKFLESHYETPAAVPPQVRTFTEVILARMDDAGTDQGQIATIRQSLDDPQVRANIGRQLFGNLNGVQDETTDDYITCLKRAIDDQPTEDLTEIIDHVQQQLSADEHRLDQAVTTLGVDIALPLAEERYLQELGKIAAATPEALSKKYLSNLKRAFEHYRWSSRLSRPTRGLVDATLYAVTFARELPLVRKAYESAHDFWTRRLGRQEDENEDLQDKRLNSEAAAFPIEWQFNDVLEWNRQVDQEGIPVYSAEEKIAAFTHAALKTKIKELKDIYGDGEKLYPQRVFANKKKFRQDSVVHVCTYFDESVKRVDQFNLARVFKATSPEEEDTLLAEIVRAELSSPQGNASRIRLSTYERAKINAAAYLSKVQDKMKSNEYQEFYKDNPDIILNFTTQGNVNSLASSGDPFTNVNGASMNITVCNETGEARFKMKHRNYDGYPMLKETAGIMMDAWRSVTVQRQYRNLPIFGITNRPPQERQRKEDQVEYAIPLLESTHTVEIDREIPKLRGTITNSRGEQVAYDLSPTTVLGIAVMLANQYENGTAQNSAAYHGPETFHLLFAPNLKQKGKTRFHSEVHPALIPLQAFDDIAHIVNNSAGISPDQLSQIKDIITDWQKYTGSEIYATKEEGMSAAAVLDAPLVKLSKPVGAMSRAILDPSLSTLLRAQGMFSPIPITKRDAFWSDTLDVIAINRFATARSDVYTNWNEDKTPRAGVYGYTCEPKSKLLEPRHLITSKIEIGDIFDIIDNFAVTELCPDTARTETPERRKKRAKPYIDVMTKLTRKQQAIVLGQDPRALDEYQEEVQKARLKLIELGVKHPEYLDTNAEFQSVINEKIMVAGARSRADKQRIEAAIEDLQYIFELCKDKPTMQE